MIAMSRSLVGQVVAGTPDSPAARAWGDFAEAFLKAHDRDGWYEAESPGYLALSVTGLLQLADHAPRARVRELARRQLDVLFAAWAQEQVGGYPAGPKSRTSAVWALSRRSSPWQAWAWLAAGMGDPEEINFMDRPELPVSRYQLPEGVVRLLTGRRKQPPYEIRERRKIEPAKRRDVDAAMYGYATPDYILGASQSVGGPGAARLRRPGDRGDALRRRPAVRPALSLEPHRQGRRRAEHPRPGGGEPQSYRRPPPRT